MNKKYLTPARLYLAVPRKYTTLDLDLLRQGDGVLRYLLTGSALIFATDRKSAQVDTDNLRNHDTFGLDWQLFTLQEIIVLARSQAERLDGKVNFFVEKISWQPLESVIALIEAQS